MNSALKRGGRGYVASFGEGGIQSYEGSHDTGMRAKIIAYFHYKLKKEKLVDGGAYTLVRDRRCNIWF